MTVHVKKTENQKLKYFKNNKKIQESELFFLLLKRWCFKAHKHELSQPTYDFFSQTNAGVQQQKSLRSSILSPIQGRLPFLSRKQIQLLIIS